MKLREIAEQRAGRADGRRIVGANAQAVERGEREPPGQLLAREVGIELPALAHRAEHAVVGRERLVGGHDDLRRAQAAERFGEAGLVQSLEQELAGTEVDGRKPDPRVRPGNGHQEVVFRPGEPALLEHGPGRHGLDDLATDETLGEPGVLDLLADGDPVARADELAEVLGGGLDRHAREGHAVAPGGQRDLEDPRSELGVLVEHLVEVADPVEQDGILVLCFDLTPMLQHAGGLAAIVGGAQV